MCLKLSTKSALTMNMMRVMLIQSLRRNILFDYMMRHKILTQK